MNSQLSALRDYPEIGEIRQNKATKQWVIFAPARGKRPKDFQQSERKRSELPDFDAACPFCPGNEHMLSAIISESGRSEPDRWQTRVVPNKFPALRPNLQTDRYTKDIYLAMPGYGRHEVIIETPYHNRPVARLSIEEIDAVIETYHRRYVEVMAEQDNLLTVVFRNHGARAGTSLIHPHSQLVVTGIVPRHIRWREEEALRYFDEWGTCVYCDILAFEQQDRRRVIFENESFLAFVPFAAEVPFEIWLMPKLHRADFGSISDEEKADLAVILRQSLVPLYEGLNDPDYNYVINTSARYRADEPQLHWFLQIRPRLTTPAGFEIGSGIRINPSLPEADADYLKEQSHRLKK
jgi:UDPglucose--hexose-1-phosphate uridylyltransferase